MRLASFFITLILFPCLLSGTSYSEYDRNFPGVIINEVMASNSITIADEDGEYHDWIELHNTGQEATDLSGYGLSDNFNDPFRWIFPKVIILPGEYLLIWASGKDRSLPGQALHTNFSISSNGEEILLTLPDGSLSDFLNPVELPADISAGRSPGNFPHWNFFDQPTPAGANNTTAWQGILSPPEFSVAPGFYEQEINLEIFSTQEGAEIFYTLDGSVPDIENQHIQSFPFKNQYPRGTGEEPFPLHFRTFQTHTYENSFTVPADNAQELAPYLINTRVWKSPIIPIGETMQGTIIRAVAAKEGFLPSQVATATYIIQPGISQRFSLPVISLAIADSSLFGYNHGLYVAGATFDKWRTQNPQEPYNGNSPANWNRQVLDFERPAHIEIFDPTGSLMWSQNLGLRIHGESSRSRHKKSLRLYARNSYDFDNIMPFEFFPGQGRLLDGQPLLEYKRILLHAGGHINNLLRDPVCHILMKHSKVGVQKVSPAVHFINGTYWGLVNFRDRLDRYHLAFNYDLDPDNIIIFNAPWNNQNSYMNQIEGIAEDIQTINDFFTYCLENDLSLEHHYNTVERMLDIDSYIDYYVIFIALTNLDWGDYGGNKHFSFWRVRNTSDEPFQDGRWRVMVWDFDFSLLIKDVDLNMFDRIFNEDNAPSDMLLNLLSNEDFKFRFINRFADHLNSSFEPVRAVAELESLYDLLAPELTPDNNRWRHHSTGTVFQYREYLKNRPFRLREHIMTHFDLADTSLITLKTDPLKGKIRINSLNIESSTPAVTDPGNWSGTYFHGIPVELEAIAAPGMIFSHWEGLPEATPAKTTIWLNQDTTITAHFWDGVIHYWHFNELNQGYIEHIEADYSLLPNALITYPGTGAGFMDRAEGTTLNSKMQQQAGFSLRLRNPAFSRKMIIQAPSTGYTGLSFSYAVQRTPNGPASHGICYSPDGGNTWKNIYPSICTQEEFHRVWVDLSRYPETYDNPQLQMRFSFTDEAAFGESGNTRIDNIVLSVSKLKADTVSPPHGILDIPYKHTFFPVSGQPPFTFTLVSGELPEGITLSKDGVLRGVPARYGTFWFNILTCDENNNCQSHTYHITIFGNELIHYWHFNQPGVIANDTIYSDHSLIASGRLYYHGNGEAIMDFTDGTHINSMFGVPQGWALRVRNPSGERELRIEMPTTGFYEPKLSFGVRRSVNGARWQQPQLSLDAGKTWQSLGLQYPVTLEFQKRTFDLSRIPGTENNPDLVFRILFQGHEAWQTAGNNHLDNIALTGKLIPGNSGAGSLFVFPNPVTANIVNLIGIHNVWLYDLSGRLILTEREVNQIVLPRLSAGVYLLKNDQGKWAKILIP